MSELQIAVGLGGAENAQACRQAKIYVQTCEAIGGKLVDENSFAGVFHYLFVRKLISRKCKQELSGRIQHK
eukprot:11019758-Alexandrium_andersonii.AAC.1